MTPLTAIAVVLLDLAGKTTVLLLLACLVVVLMRRASAASRHTVWMGALITVLLLPIARSALPPLRVFVLPPAAGAGAALADQVSPTSTEPMPARLRSPVYDNAPRDLAPATPLKAAAGPASTPRASSDVAVSRGWSAMPWTRALAGIWLTGLAAMLLRLVVGRWGVARLARRSRPAGDARILARVMHLAGLLGITRRIDTLISPGESMPVTWGVRRPTLLLPSCAATWPDARLDAVLVHELAHVARLDALSNAIGQTAAALLWFHPLVWLAAKRARAERERACDDRVLVHGRAASQYAGDLFELMQSLSRPTVAASAALAMARPSQFEGRVIAILDPRANRRGLSKVSVAFAAAIVLLTLPIAAARLVALPAARPLQPLSPVVGAGYIRPLQTPTWNAAVASGSQDPALHRAQTSGTTNEPALSTTPAAEPAVVQITPIAQRQETADFSGRWIPLDPAAQESLFDVGLSGIDGNGITIVQDAKTLTLTRHIPSHVVQIRTEIGTLSPLDVQTIYNLDIASVKAGAGGYNIASWVDHRLVMSQVNAQGERRTSLSMEGGYLNAEGFGPSAILFKKATPPPHPDFAGTWVSDIDRNATLVTLGLWAPLDQQAVLTVTQDESRMAITYTYPQGVPFRATYAFDGSETGYTGYYYSGTPVNQAHWDGDSLMVASTTPRRPVEFTTYSMDGAELKIETTTTTARNDAARADTLLQRGLISQRDYDAIVARAVPVVAYYKRAK